MDTFIEIKDMLRGGSVTDFDQTVPQFVQTVNLFRQTHRFVPNSYDHLPAARKSGGLVDVMNAYEVRTVLANKS